MADLRFKQICVGQYTGAGRDARQSFIVIGLSEDGKVYQFKGGRWQNLEEMFASPSKATPIDQGQGPGQQERRAASDEAPW